MNIYVLFTSKMLVLITLFNSVSGKCRLCILCDFSGISALPCVLFPVYRMS